MSSSKRQRERERDRERETDRHGQRKTEKDTGYYLLVSLYGMSSLLPAAEADTEEEGESGLDRLAYKKKHY